MNRSDQHNIQIREAVKKIKVLNFGHWPNLCDPPLPLKLWTPYIEKIIIAGINSTSFETCFKQNLF